MTEPSNHQYHYLFTIVTNTLWQRKVISHNRNHILLPVPLSRTIIIEMKRVYFSTKFQRKSPTVVQNLIRFLFIDIISIKKAGGAMCISADTVYITQERRKKKHLSSGN